MNKEYTAHILSHTHWDREWYLNSPYTNEWLIPFFDGLFAMMDKEPEYKFILDGQLSMIDDYFEELAKNGMSVSAAKRRIKKDVERKALSIGPYYLQPDWQLLSEESLVRNLMIGQKMADSLGGSMKSGWLLDNFGQISQTAQIHKQAGLTGLFAWRGVAMDPEKVTSEFIWESPDGTKLLSVYLLNSYRNVMRLAEYDSIMNQRMDAEIEKLKPFAATSNILMMNGYDQEMIPDDIQPYIRSGALDGKDYKTVQNDPDSYLKAVAEENPDLPVLKGALYNGRFISVFPGVMSARMYLKLQNDQMQKLLEKQVEPVALMAGLLGSDEGKSQIEQAWKTLLKNHPHDSICGVSIDDVHKDMEMRSRQVYQLGTSLLEDKAAYLAGAVDTSACKDDEALILFNTMLKERNSVVQWKGKSRYVTDIPAMGYKVVTGTDSPASTVKTEGRKAENSHFNFELNENGSFNLKYKQTGKEYRNMGLLEDMGDSGDEYNYSFPDEDLRLTSEDVKAKIELIRSEAWEACYRVEYAMDLPVSDVNDHKQRSGETLQMPVVSYITIEADSPVVKCRTSLRNTVRDHRIRVLFPTGIDAETAYAASPFDITERPIHIADYNEEEIPEHVRKVIVGAREAKPSTYFQTREFLDLNDGKEGLAVFNKGLPEYQVIETGTLALTLFRSVGWIAKEINTRIGDAGPEIYTPDAQCLREMSFEYAVCPHKGDAYSGVLELAEEFNSDLIAVSTTPSKGPLKPVQSWFRLQDPRSCSKVTAVKGSEDGRAVIIRGVNLSTEKTDLIFSSAFAIKGASLVNFLEEFQSDLHPADDKVTFSVKPKEIFTLRLELESPEMPAVDSAEVILESEAVNEDFSSYPYTSYVKEEEIDSERQRADGLKEKIEDPHVEADSPGSPAFSYPLPSPEG